MIANVLRALDDPPGLGLEAFPFGSAVITSVGMMGLDEGFAPPTPFARNSPPPAKTSL